MVTRFNSELDRRCNKRPITGEELDLIENLIAYRDELNANGPYTRKYLSMVLNQLAIVESDNEHRRAELSAQLTEEMAANAHIAEAAQ